MTWKKLAVLVIPALVLTLVTTGNVRADLITNGGFEMTTNPFGAGQKQGFPTPGVIGWGGGAGGLSPSATFLCAPGTADNPALYLDVWSPFPATSPNGGNFVLADGDPTFRATPITQTVNGLTVGQTYAVSFFQAAGQQRNFTGATFEYWEVTFGTQTQNSTQMNTPSMGVVPWQQETLLFTATSTSQVLSFLAVGNLSGGGAPSLPPIVFLDGVSVNAVPEPTSLFLMGSVLIGLGVAYRRQRAALAAAA